MINVKLKQQKGFATSDALIAILIIALFAGLVASISYNIYLANSSIKRMSNANSYIVDVFEYIDKNYYDDITIENLINYFNNKYYYAEDGTTVKTDAQAKAINSGEENADTPYTVELNITNYNETEGNTDKFDLVKEIVIKVSYKLGGKNQTIEMKRVKQRESLETPNRPDLNLIELSQGEKVYCIKNVNSSWQVCDETDSNWYNYQNGNWAVILKTTEDLITGDSVDVNNLEQDESTLVWIPRYAYDDTNNKVLFLFSNSNSYVDTTGDYRKLVDINKILDETYTVTENFSKDGSAITGIWTSDKTLNEYKNLNNVYEMKY